MRKPTRALAIAVGAVAVVALGGVTAAAAFAGDKAPKPVPSATVPALPSASTVPDATTSAAPIPASPEPSATTVPATPAPVPSASTIPATAAPVPSASTVPATPVPSASTVPATPAPTRTAATRPPKPRPSASLPVSPGVSAAS